jgi:hypothetical protein
VIVVEDASSIPIFVATSNERLPSQYLPRLQEDDDHETRPHATALVPKVAPARPWGVRIAVAALVAVLLALAFLAGRYWK